ncbi:hypothetical protein [Nitrogeniibacter aestuarii]|uniref:hypothetical protein n=1 Tax=Nitrogeniibacter aestuarii TaxID=2815343 RepID=UPI001D1267FC|nr:hypothetical protein [Nitrogeniibacter aestuarii]
MKTTLLFALLAGSNLAYAEAFPHADPAEGKALHAEKCIACHEKDFGGEEGSAIYLRPDRKVNTVSGLKSQLTACTTMLSLDLFPEDEANIGAYLNNSYYKFETP